MLTLPMNHLPPNTMLIHADLMPVETCLSTLLSLVVGSVVDEGGGGVLIDYILNVNMISYNVEYVKCFNALITPRKKSFIIIYFNIYFLFLTQG